MELTKKLILEDLLDDDTSELLADDKTADIPEVELTSEEQSNFEVSTVSDLLNTYLGLFASIKSISCVPELSEGLRTILMSVSDDTAVIIGKLQEGLKAGSSEGEEGLIVQGQEVAQDLLIDEKEE